MLLFLFRKWIWKKRTRALHLKKHIKHITSACTFFSLLHQYTHTHTIHTQFIAHKTEIDDVIKAAKSADIKHLGQMNFRSENYFLYNFQAVCSVSAWIHYSRDFKFVSIIFGFSVYSPFLLWSFVTAHRALFSGKRSEWF